MARNRWVAAAVFGAVTAGLVSISVPAHAADNDSLLCSNGFRPGGGNYVDCRLFTNPGSATQQVWKKNRIQFATNTSHVTPGCSNNSVYTITVTYLDGNGNSSSLSDTGTCGGANY